MKLRKIPLITFLEVAWDSEESHVMAVDWSCFETVPPACHCMTHIKISQSLFLKFRLRNIRLPEDDSLVRCALQSRKI
jgi:hypothetical protein